MVNYLILLVLLSFPWVYASDTTTPISLPPDGGIAETYWLPIPPNEDCKPLQNGQSKEIRVDKRAAYTGVDSRYRVSHLQGKQYRIDLNIDFAPSRERVLLLAGAGDNFLKQQWALLRNGATRRSINESWQALAQICLDRVQGRLRSKDGTRFKIYLNSTDSRYRSRQKPWRVKIGFPGQPSNREKWKGDMNCSVIVHEVFHMLGLPDGYPSNSLSPEEVKTSVHSSVCLHYQNPITSSCRHPEPTGIMNDYLTALSDQGESFKGFVCTPNVAREMSNLYFLGHDLPDDCPPNHTLTAYSRGGREFIPFNWVNGEQTGKILYLKRSDPPPQFALGNAHSKYILNPRCVSENRLYLTCVQNAPRFSKDGCLNTPAACQGDFIN